MYEVDLADKVAVVTGGTRGIGKHIAEALHVVGANVAVTSRNLEDAEAAAADVGESCRGYACDQRDPEAVRIFAEAVGKDLGPPDILVNNAAAAFGGISVVDTRMDQWRETIETNLTGVFLMTQAFLPAMISRNHGDIFMIGSTSGIKGDAGWSAYAASKFGLRGFSQSLLYEVRRHNIRVMLLEPSSVNKGQDVGPTEGLGPHLHAADIAATIVHLCGLPRRTLVRELEIWGTNP